jgi:hypothetical protein
MQVVFTGNQSTNLIEDWLYFSIHTAEYVTPLEFQSEASGARHIERYLKANSTVQLKILQATTGYFGSPYETANVAYLMLHKINVNS